MEISTRDYSKSSKQLWLHKWKLVLVIILKAANSGDSINGH